MESSCRASLQFCATVAAGQDFRRAAAAAQVMPIIYHAVPLSAQIGVQQPPVQQHSKSFFIRTKERQCGLPLFYGRVPPSCASWLTSAESDHIVQTLHKAMNQQKFAGPLLLYTAIPHILLAVLVLVSALIRDDVRGPAIAFVVVIAFCAFFFHFTLKWVFARLQRATLNQACRRLALELNSSHRATQRRESGQATMPIRIRLSVASNRSFVVGHQFDVQVEFDGSFLSEEHPPAGLNAYVMAQPLAQFDESYSQRPVHIAEGQPLPPADIQDAVILHPSAISVPGNPNSSFHDNLPSAPAHAVNQSSDPSFSEQVARRPGSMDPSLNLSSDARPSSPSLAAPEAVLIRAMPDERRQHMGEVAQELATKRQPKVLRRRKKKPLHGSLDPDDDAADGSASSMADRRAREPTEFERKYAEALGGRVLEVSDPSESQVSVQHRDRNRQENH